jgi:hypothetical protein
MTKSPRRALVAIAALTAFAFLGGIAAAGVGDVFTDVGDDHPFEEEIEEFAGAGITQGYPDGTYRGGDPVTRQAMAAFMVRGLPRLGYATSESEFTVGGQITLLTVSYDVPGAPGGTQRLVVDATTTWQVDASTKADACDNAASQPCEFIITIYDNGVQVNDGVVGRVTTGDDGGVVNVQAIIPNAPTGTTRTITFRAERGTNLQSAELQLTQRQMTVQNVPFFS